MKKMKKLLGFVLALAMVLGLTVTSFAASGNYTITINNTTSGYTYAAYQVFDGDLSTDAKILSNVSWGDGVDGDALLKDLKEDTDTTKIVDADSDGTKDKTVAELFANCTDAADVAEILSTYNTNNDLAEAFAEIAAKKLSTTTSGTCTDNATANGTYTISGLDAGYYLVKTTVVPNNGTHSNYILKVTDNVTVDTKSETLTIDKAVGDEDTSDDDSTEDYDIGDNVPFTLTATLPSDYADYSSYKLTFHDTLSTGLSFNDNVVVTVYANSSANNGTVVASGYSVVKTGLNDGCSFEVQIVDTNSLKDSDDKVISVTKDSTIVVTYTAKLNTNATSVENNDVYLEYTNSPYDDGTGTTTNDKTYVVTFTLNVDKTDGTSALEGAGFTLYKAEQVTVDAASFAPDSTTYYIISNGKWIQVAADATYDLNETYYVYNAVGDEKTGGSSFAFSGLATGYYKLVETTTPSGYNTADDLYFTLEAVTVEDSTDSSGVRVDSITVKDAAGNVISGTGATFTVSVTGKSLNTTVVNNAGSSLPSTGGIGTTLFYIIGGILVVGAAVVLVTRRRMRRA